MVFSYFDNLLFVQVCIIMSGDAKALLCACKLMSEFCLTKNLFYFYYADLRDVATIGRGEDAGGG